jgi:SAM-dependent methyltransferase
VLDVGCAYAGFVILSAKLGASAWGVEVDPRFYRYGELNARGEPGDINLIHADILSHGVLEQLPRDFDLVLLNDVFEHIYDTSRLLAQLHQLLNDKGLIVFTIPNAEALEHLAREGHQLRPGLSLLPPNLWHHAVGDFTAYYRPWSYYLSLFRAFGFGEIRLWNATPELSFDEMTRRLPGGLDQAEAEIGAAKFKENVETAMLSALTDLRTRVKRDVERRDVRLLHWKYFVKFWQGCAVRTGVIPGGLDLFL